MDIRTEQPAIVENRTPHDPRGRAEPEHGDAGQSGRETYAERTPTIVSSRVCALTEETSWTGLSSRSRAQA
jgi:hypothetical protein